MSQEKHIWHIEKNNKGGFHIIDVFDHIAVACRTESGARGWIAGYEYGYKDGAAWAAKLIAEGVVQAMSADA